MLAVRRLRVPHEASSAAKAQVELGGVSEPLGDVLGLGDHGPSDIDRRLDVDFTLYPVGPGFALLAALAAVMIRVRPNDTGEVQPVIA